MGGNPIAIIGGDEGAIVDLKRGGIPDIRCSVEIDEYPRGRPGSPEIRAQADADPEAALIAQAIGEQ